MSRDTLQDLVNRLPAYRERPAFLSLQEKGVEAWSYAMLYDHVTRVARGLLAKGMTPQDRIILLGDNSPAWIITALAVIRTGAVIVPIDIQFSLQNLQHVIEDCGARWVITTRKKSEEIGQLDLGDDVTFVLMDGEEDSDHHWQNLPDDESQQMKEREPSDIAALFYTSGTTGPPKGVPLSHCNLTFQLNALAEAGFVGENDRVVVPLPLHHVYPLSMGMLASLSLGVPLVLPRALTGPEILRALKEGQGTLMIGVPRLYRALRSGIEGQLESKGKVIGYGLRSALKLSIWLRRYLGVRLGKYILRPIHQQIGPKLRVAASGGSALAPDLAWWLEGMGWQLTTGYGLTETAPLLTMDPPGKARIGSVGRAIPGVELRVAAGAQATESTTGHSKDIPYDQGEILCRGPNVFEGYLNLPDKTAEAFTEDGWFRTDDLGYLDHEGYLFVLGRASTLIVTEGGKNIQPDEVEEIYQQHTALREVGILEQEGHLVALIVPEMQEIATRDPDEAERVISSAVQEGSKHLASYKRVSDYVITHDPLPRTRLGKLRRHLLSEHYKKATQGTEGQDERSIGPISPDEMAEEDRVLLENDAAKEVWAWIGRRYPDKRVAPDTHLQLGLGIDSMEWLNLTLDLAERVGVELSEESLSRSKTVRDLLQEVIETGESERRNILEAPEQAIGEREKQWLEPLGPAATFLSKNLYRLNRAIMRTLFRLHVQGTDNLPEHNGFLLVANHTSYLDPFAIAASLDDWRLSHTCWAGWTGIILSNPLNRQITRLARALPIDPQRQVLSGVALAITALKRGYNLVWFPEGQRSQSGELQKFRPGIGILLEHASVQVIPATVSGTYEAMPPGKIFPRFFKRLTIAFGKPIAQSELQGLRGRDDAHTQIAAAVRESVLFLGHDKHGPS